MLTYIYSLSDPVTKEVRYIGKTNNLEQRFKNHKNSCRDLGTHKRNWINSLSSRGLKPEIEIVDLVPIEEWQYWEIFWISQFKTWGFNLINYTEGGDGSTFGNSGSFKKGGKSWNLHRGNKFICEECNVLFKAPKSSNRRFCSHECNGINKKKELNSGNYTKNVIPWNKDIIGYKTSKRKPVLQYSLLGEFIKEYESCAEVAEEFKCSRGNIENVCTGRSKTAKGYLWKYKINNI